MNALIDLLSRSVLGVACCAVLAFGLSFVGQMTIARGDDVHRQLAVGHCRQCGNSIRFQPGEWCATCRACKQLTNIDQALEFHRPTEGHSASELPALAELR